MAPAGKVIEKLVDGSPTTVNFPAEPTPVAIRSAVPLRVPAREASTIAVVANDLAPTVPKLRPVFCESVSF